MLFRKILTSGNSRSVKAKKNILGSFGIKGLAILIGFIKVPIILFYLDTEKYGVWLTIASIVDWVHYFDLGLGHGLRNKFAEALALDNHDLAHKLVSTTYYYIVLIFSGVFVCLLPLVLFINWQSVLNTSIITQKELVWSVLVVLTMFVLRFSFYQISMILKADQRPAIADLFMPLANILTLIIVVLLKFVSNNSLFLACLAISAPPAIVLLIANLYFFHRDYSAYIPSLDTVDKSLFKDTFTLGLKFFIIQLTALVLFASSNLILAQAVNPSEVTLYNICRQYYTMPYMLFSIVLTPYWSAITDAFVRKEYDWIRIIMKKLLYVAVFFSIFELFMLLVSPVIFKIWLGSMVEIPTILSVMSTIMFVFTMFGAPYSYFLNGVGKLEISIFIGFFEMIVFIPIALALSERWGASGLILSLLLVNSLPSLIQGSIQYWLIISKKAQGIWNK